MDYRILAEAIKDAVEDLELEDDDSIADLLSALEDDDEDDGK